MCRGQPAQSYEIFVGADFFTLAFLSAKKGNRGRGSAPRLNVFIEIKKDLNTKRNAEFRPAPKALFWDASEKCPKERTLRKSFSPCSVGPAKF
jgi:hypothetical protein